MPGPWEKYGKQPEAEQGPWTKYAPTTEIPADQGEVLPPEDNRNGLQKAFDDLTTHQDYTPIHSVADVGKNALTAAGNFGGGVINMARPLFHPVETAKSMAVAPKFEPVDLLGPAGRPIESLVKEIGAGHGAEALPGILSAFIAPEAADTAGTTGANIVERYGGGYRSPVIPKVMQQASRVAEAIRPVGGIMPHFEADLATHLPLVKAFAEETGNPLHSQWEVSEAARGLANKGLEHFKTSILGPNAERQVSMRTMPEYQGPVTGEGRMTTLGAIEKRISDINDLTRGAMRSAKTTGQEMTAAEKLGLENEGSKLRNLLYRELGEHTGIDPDMIRDFRQNYGQQFNIADTIDAARRARLGQTGATAEMGGTVPFTKTGLLEKAMQKLRGGQEYIADARLRKAIAPFEAKPMEFPESGAWPRLKELLTPTREPLWKGIQNERPPVLQPTVDVDAAGRLVKNLEDRRLQKVNLERMAADNRAAAAQEVTHAHELQNAAQDASTTRSERASGLRTLRRKALDAQNKLEGESLRTIARNQGRLR